MNKHEYFDNPELWAYIEDAFFLPPETPRSLRHEAYFYNEAERGKQVKKPVFNGKGAERHGNMRPV